MKNTGLPTIRHDYHGKFDSLKVGQSVRVPTLGGVHAAYRYAKKNNKHFVRRRLEDGWKMWRVK